MQVHQIINILHQYRVIEEKEGQGEVSFSYAGNSSITVRVFEFAELRSILVSFFFEPDSIDVSLQIPHGTKEVEVKKMIRNVLSKVEKCLQK